MKQFFFVGIALSIPIILGGVLLYWFFGGLWTAYSDFRLRRELKEIENESQVRRGKVDPAKIPTPETEVEEPVVSPVEKPTFGRIDEPNVARPTQDGVPAADPTPEKDEAGAVAETAAAAPQAVSEQTIQQPVSESQPAPIISTAATEAENDHAEDDLAEASNTQESASSEPAVQELIVESESNHSEDQPEQAESAAEAEPVAPLETHTPEHEADVTASEPDQQPKPQPFPPDVTVTATPPGFVHVDIENDEPVSEPVADAQIASLETAQQAQPESTEPGAIAEKAEEVAPQPMEIEVEAPVEAETRVETETPVEAEAPVETIAEPPAAEPEHVDTAASDSEVENEAENAIPVAIQPENIQTVNHETHSVPAAAEESTRSERETIEADASSEPAEQIPVEQNQSDTSDSDPLAAVRATIESVKATIASAQSMIDDHLPDDESADAPSAPTKDSDA